MRRSVFDLRSHLARERYHGGEPLAKFLFIGVIQHNGVKPLDRDGRCVYILGRYFCGSTLTPFFLISKCR